MEKNYDDEINLFELFQKLWAGKWKIIRITFIFVLMGIGFIIIKPSSFQVSTDIRESPSGTFIKYLPINEILIENNLKSKYNVYSIDSTSVLQLVINEFNDYNEIRDVLMKDKLVNESIKNLNESEKKKALTEISKSFKIVAPDKNRKHWSLSFEWHDITDGQKLFEEALLLTLRNVKKTIIKDVRNLGSFIDLRTKHKIDNIKLEISSLTQQVNLRAQKKLQYLSEQANIARELGLEDNSFDKNVLPKGQLGALSFSFNSQEIPLYLHGFKAIDKSISLIKSRSSEEKLLMTSGYLEKKEELNLLENNLTTTHLKSALQAIESDNPDTWVDFDFLLSDSKSQKKSKLIVALAIVLGGMVGVFYVMISNAITKQKL